MRDAHKRATSLYTLELMKSNGMTAAEVKVDVEKEYGEGMAPSCCTNQKKMSCPFHDGVSE